MIKDLLKYGLIAGVLLGATTSLAQDDEDVYITISDAERPISPSYRIAEKPTIIDTIVPIPNISYPLLSRNMRTEISIEQIEASKIRIVNKLDKLYPGYVKLGIGNYISPLGEVYYNSGRNRRNAWGVHLNHNSSFGNIKDYAPSSFDNTTGKLFGEFHTARFKYEGELDYLNNGYHFYGIRDTSDFFSKDSLRNRVQGIKGSFKFSNVLRKDSAKVLYTVWTDYMHFHEFDPDEMNLNARNSNFGIGTNLAYKLKRNVYAVDFGVRYNKHKWADGHPDIALADRRDEDNTLVQLKPMVSSYGKNWKAIYGVNINFDFLGDQIFRVVPIVEGRYSLFNNMFIPYAGIGGGVDQVTFYTLNRINPFILSGIDLKNPREFKFYGGIKGTLSKEITFNIQVYSSNTSDMALFVNDTTMSDFYRFGVVYDDVSALGITGSASYQMNEKLKVDAIVKYNNFTAANELHAWNLPAIDITLRGSYNLFDKLYVKSDLTMLGGRKSPEGLFVTDATDEDFELGFVADANLHAEYRYNNRISVFIQFNNLAAQKYFRWNRYRVQGFQVLGGFTYAF